MNLSKRVIQQLEQLAAKGPQQIEAVILPNQGSYIVGVPGEDNEPSTAITLEAYDRYSVTMRSLEVTASHLPAKSTTELRRCADEVARRLSYLEEPLILLELDQEDNQAQLRSQSPHQEGEGCTYWEAMLWASPHPRLRLARYRWSPDQTEREIIAYPTTFAMMGRIVQDLASSLVN
jgi:hypothetical protein